MAWRSRGASTRYVYFPHPLNRTARYHNLTYQTPPRQETIKQNQREVRLDLAGGSPLPDLGSGLARLRRWTKRNPLPDDEPGGVDDLVEESRQLADHCAEATRQLTEK